MKKEFMEIARREIRRQGIDELLNFLENRTDFFVSPASTMYHGAEKEGLVKHSLKVRECLNSYCDVVEATTESITISALFHDLCKVNSYITDTRNVKINGVWEKVSYYKFDPERICYGHGEESVLIIERYMKLTKAERFAIRYHMGAYVDGDIKNLTNVYKNYKLAFYLHVADMESSLYEERR